MNQRLLTDNYLSSNILGYFGSGKTWTLAEILKIKVDQQHERSSNLRRNTVTYLDE